MGTIFKEKNKTKIATATAPEEPESVEEQKIISELTEETESEDKKVSYREVPVCMSQEQINTLVIENNLMLKEVITRLS